MTSDLALPPETQTAVNAELAPGERVVWSGQPIAGRLARKGLLLSLFAIPFAGFAVFWMVGAGATTSHFTGSDLGPVSWVARLFPLFGLPFLCVGLGMFFSPLWLLRRAKRTVYLVTDRRAIILAPAIWRGVMVRSFMPDRLKDLRRTQNADGSGDIVFTSEWQNTGNQGARSLDVGFLAIPDVKRVEDSIRALVERADGRGA